MVNRREPQLVDHGRRQVAQAHGTVDHSASGCARSEDHQRDAGDVQKETEAVAEGPMIAKRFPVVRRDDHHGVFEESLAVQSVEQTAELRIKKSDAIVVAIVGQLNIPFHIRTVRFRHMTEQEIVIPWRPGTDPNRPA